MKQLLLTCFLACALAGAASADSLPTPSSGPSVTLMSPGKGRLAPLRYRPTKGAAETLAMSMKMELAMNMGGTALPAQKMPAVISNLALKVVDIAANGDIRYDFEILGFSVARDKGSNPEVVAALESTLKKMEHIPGYAVVSDRGFTREVKIQAPSGIGAQEQQLLASMQQSFEQMSAPLPAEPVGKQARWKTTATISLNGMTIEQTAMTELVQQQGKRLKLKISITQSAKPQRINANGVTAELTKYEGSGGGEISTDLGRVTPKAATMDMKSHTELTAGGQAVSLALVAQIKVSSR